VEEVEGEALIGDVVGIVEDLGLVEEDILLTKDLCSIRRDGKVVLLAVRIGLTEREMSCKNSRPERLYFQLCMYLLSDISAPCQGQ